MKTTNSTFVDDVLNATLASHKLNTSVNAESSVFKESIPGNVQDVDVAESAYSRLGYGDLSDANTKIMLSAIVSGAVLLIIIVYLFARHVPHILRITPSKYLARTLILCGVYPIVGSAAFVSLIALRASVLCDSICHFTFVLCAYQYFALTIEYVGGETKFIKRSGGLMAFNLQTPPLCCCLGFMTPTLITKKKFLLLRLMVMQMSIFQGILLALINILHSIDPLLEQQLQPFILPLIVASILTGVWGLQINSRMIAPYVPEHKIIGKYFAIQLVLILYKLQPILFHLFWHVIELWTSHQIMDKIIEHAIIQLIILAETVFLAYFANLMYNLPTKANLEG